MSNGLTSRCCCSWAVRKGHLSYKLIVEAVTVKWKDPHIHCGKFFIRHPRATEQTKLFHLFHNTTIYSLQDKDTAHHVRAGL